MVSRSSFASYERPTLSVLRGTYSDHEPI